MQLKFRVFLRHSFFSENIMVDPGLEKYLNSTLPIGQVNLKVPVSSKIFIFRSDPSFHAMNICEKNFRFG